MIYKIINILQSFSKVVFSRAAMKDTYNSQISKHKIIKFANCTLIDNGHERRDNLWVRNDKIIDGHDIFYKERVLPDITIDCKGYMLSPGFLDLQINGGFGVDFSDPKVDVDQSVKILSKELVKHGVTAFCPTVITSSSETYKKILPLIKRSKCSASDGAAVLGVHLEGPFISKDKKGAHDLNLMQEFDNGVEALDKIYGPGLNQARIVTLAPELSNAASVIHNIRYKRDIRVSIGHSIANLEQAEEAINAGANMITHLFNAMRSFHHRDPHIVGLLTSDRITQNAYFGIIADGIHTHPAAIRLAWRALPHNLMLVTDAMAALGLGLGHYKLGNLDVSVVDSPHQCAFLTNNDGSASETLAGSIVSMPECVWNLSQHARCPIATALKSATKIPARALNIDMGSLRIGADADIVLLDSSNGFLDVKATFTRGQLAFLKADENLSLCER